MIEVHPEVLDALRGSRPVVGLETAVVTCGLPERPSDTDGGEPLNVAGLIQVELVIDATSVFTRQRDRDNHLRSPDFFNAKEFKQLRFVGTRIAMTDKRTGKLTGNITLLGVTKPVTFDVTLNRVAAHPDPRKKVLVAGFSARGTVKRSEFGMTYGAPGIGDLIEIWLEIEGESPLPGG